MLETGYTPPVEKNEPIDSTVVTATETASDTPPEGVVIEKTVGASPAESSVTSNTSIADNAEAAPSTETENHNWKPGDFGHYSEESGDVFWNFFRVTDVKDGKIFAEYPQAASASNPSETRVTWPGGSGYTREYTANQIVFVPPEKVRSLKEQKRIIG